VFRVGRCIAALLLFVTASFAGEAEFRGAWVATVHNIDWPSRAGLPAAKQKAELRALLDTAKSLNLNAILLQVRPSCDAVYASKIEPWSAFLTGTMGQNPGYDPLAYAIEEAHRRGIELHAWFNPYRALTSTKSTASPGHISRRRPDLVRRYGGGLWLDPGEQEVSDYSISVIMDVVRRYDIDGVHLDDYFYPYPTKTSKGATVPFQDDLSYARYLKSGGKLDRANWRRQNVNEFVERLGKEIHRAKRNVTFGISPFGIWRPRVPGTIEAGLDAYDELYADSRLWLQRGWIDYLAPQLYWGIEPAKQSFPVLLDWWREQNTQGRGLWPGIATERIGPNRRASEIVRQIELTRKGTSRPGHIHWSMKALMQNQGGIADLLRKGVYEESARVPR
jgi:uncharacterized lipoprotein YddW (UPF0748 family)